MVIFRNPFRNSTGKIFMLLLLAILLFVLMLASLCVGSLKLSMFQIIETMLHQENRIYYQIIYNIRLPRIILGALVGGALAVSGAILQSVMRNPLASPEIIGVSAGGGLGGILVMLVFPAFSFLLLPAAFAGALLTALWVYLLAWKDGASPVRLVLSGIAISAMLGALSSAILLFNAEKAGGVLNFAIGTLSAKTWVQIHQSGIYMVIGLLLAFFTGRQLNILGLGDEVASALGQNVERIRFYFLAIAALLAGAAVSVAGLLGFVGLIAPHIIRIVIGGDNRFLLIGSALFGGIMVVACDTAGRLIMNPDELPIGIIMALIGPPFFLYLLRSHKYES